MTTLDIATVGLVVATIALFLATGALVVVGVMQWLQLRRTATLAGHQTEVQRASSELSFYLDVVTRLDAVLLAIADCPDAHRHVWNASPETPPLQDNSSGHVLTQSLIDVLELTLAAADRLPGFAANANDWRSYVEYVFAQSAAVRNEITTQPVWWPYIVRELAAWRLQHEDGDMLRGLSDHSD